jgi:16S rRNA (adenine1518-N6/adenine1519-N6)-dimethyltransferase
VTFPTPKKILEEYSLTPKHSFGQNFLTDPNLAAKIAALALPDPGVRVLEIGAGLGALTDELLKRASHVVAVERDRDLVPVLEELFQDQLREKRLQILEADAKAVDWEEAVNTMGHRESRLDGFVLAGNLPYQITGPLLERTVQLAPRIQRAVYLVQKEVADRLAAGPGTKTYGALSVFVQAQFLVKRAFVIKAGAFYPQPRIDSAVISLTPLPSPYSQETPEFRKVVKGAFLQRRKTLRNGWKSLCPRDDLLRLASECEIDLDRRGETLSLSEFARMTRALTEYLSEAK